MNILSIQSHVAYGHVGNAAATFPLQRIGIEVWPIHTVQFSNHTGYGAWKGRVFDGPMIDEVMDGVAERGVLPRCDGVLSGYMGSSDIGEAILLLAFGIVLSQYWLMLPVWMRSCAGLGLSAAFAMVAYRFFKFRSSRK